MQLWEILVPTVRRIDGCPIKTRFHKVWDAKVRALSGGLTILRPAIGQWISPTGELFKERMIPVRVLCSREQIEAIAKMTLQYYDQLAIMYYKVSDAAYILENNNVAKKI